jgi:hypothetical protein
MRTEQEKRSTEKEKKSASTEQEKESASTSTKQENKSTEQENKSTEQEKKKQSMEQFKRQPRLPKFAVPKHYDIKLEPDLTAYNFDGSVWIELNIVEDTSFIVLNAAELYIDTASVSLTRHHQVLT